MSKRIGLYVDLSNINQSGGFLTKFDVLTSFASKGGELIKSNIYVAVDVERSETNYSYERSTIEFHSLLRDFGYKVVEKKVKWHNIELDSGEIKKIPKSDADIEIAVDVLSQASQLDKIILVTGDGDFIPLVRALQLQGKIVELVGFKNVSSELRKLVDKFHSGYLIPNLLSTTSEKEWGEIGSIVRGVCFKYLHDKSYGFFRYYSPTQSNTSNDIEYETVFVHGSELATTLPNYKLHVLPNRELIFEFLLAEDNNHRLKAESVSLIQSY